LALLLLQRAALLCSALLLWFSLEQQQEKGMALLQGGRKREYKGDKEQREYYLKIERRELFLINSFI
jgi:hypothetical protein